MKNISSLSHLLIIKEFTMSNNPLTNDNSITNEIYFINESDSDYPQYVYWIEKFNIIANHYDNSPNFWHVVDDPEFLQLIHDRYGVQLILESQLFLIGVKIINTQKKLLLDLL